MKTFNEYSVKNEKQSSNLFFKKLILTSDVGAIEINRINAYINYKLQQNKNIEIQINKVKFKDLITVKIFEMLIYYACKNSTKLVKINISGYILADRNENELCKYYLNFKNLFFFEYFHFEGEKMVIELTSEKKAVFCEKFEDKICSLSDTEEQNGTRIKYKLKNQENIEKAVGDALFTIENKILGILDEQMYNEIASALYELLSETYTNACDHANSSIYIDIEVQKIDSFYLVSYLAYNYSDILIFTKLMDIITTQKLNDNHKELLGELLDEYIDLNLVSNDEKEMYFFKKVLQKDISTREDCHANNDSGRGLYDIIQLINSRNEIKYFDYPSYIMSGDKLYDFDNISKSSYYFPGTLIFGQLIMEER